MLSNHRIMSITHLSCIVGSSPCNGHSVLSTSLELGGILAKR
jgi:hypothetical protein